MTCQPTVGQQSAVCRPTGDVNTVSQLASLISLLLHDWNLSNMFFAMLQSHFFFSQLLVTCRSTVGYMSADSWPTVRGGEFFFFSPLLGYYWTKTWVNLLPRQCTDVTWVLSVIVSFLKEPIGSE